MTARDYAVLFVIVFVAGFASSFTADVVYSIAFMRTVDDDDTSTVCLEQKNDAQGQGVDRQDRR